jgi:diketogulonate reductase-like aldo/keto reductase
MAGQSLSLAEPLLNIAAPCNARSSGKALALVSLLIGVACAVLLSSAVQDTAADLALDAQRPLMYDHWRGVRPLDQAGVLPDKVNTSAGIEMPRLLYKVGRSDNMGELLITAVRDAGFRGIETSGMPCKSQRLCERQVGKALGALLAKDFKRDELFIQTRFSPDQAEEVFPGLTVTKQVELTIANSLADMGLDYVDSLVFFSPGDVHKHTMEAWRAMEAAVRSGFVRQLGISTDGSITELARIYADASVKPAIVLQRAATESQHVGNQGLERDLLTWCADRGIYYQSFSILEANKATVMSEMVQGMAAKYGVTPQVLFYRFVMGLGIVPLTGTKNDMHMYEGLSSWLVPLKASDATLIENYIRYGVTYATHSEQHAKTRTRSPLQLPLRSQPQSDHSKPKTRTRSPLQLPLLSQPQSVFLQGTMRSSVKFNLPEVFEGEDRRPLR